MRWHMDKPLMLKKLSHGQVVEFHKIIDGTFRYEVVQGPDIRNYGPFNSLLEAVNHFKAEYREREIIGRKQTEEQELIDQFNAWNGDIKEMEGFTI